jgi:hypothetical protein
MIEFNANSSDYVSKDGVLYEKTSNGLSLIKYPAKRNAYKYKIDSNTVSIQKYAFLYADELDSINLCGKLTTISEYAFEYCTSLELLWIGNNVKEIGDGAFMYCTNLSNILVGTDDKVALSKIGDKAFYGCYNFGTFYYYKTKDDWEQITKGSSWDENIRYMHVYTPRDSFFADFTYPFYVLL